MGTTNTLDLNNRINELEKAVSGGDSAQANKTDIATEFSATTNYTAGCFVYYGGKLYQFNADHSAGAWDPTDAVEANVTDQVVSNAATIAGLTATDVAYDNTDSGLSATDVQGALDELRQAGNVMMSDGVTSVEDAVDNVFTATNGTGVSGTFKYAKIGHVVVGSGLMTMDQNLSEYSAIVTDLPRPNTITMGAFEANDSAYNHVFVNDYDNVGMITTRIARNSGDPIRLSCVYLSAN